MHVLKLKTVNQISKTDALLLKMVYIFHEIFFARVSGKGGVGPRVLNVNNATFTFPSSPLLTQRADVPEETLCASSSDDDDARNENNEIPSPSSRRCRSDGTVGDTCECVHLKYIPLGATVEIILLDQGNEFYLA